MWRPSHAAPRSFNGGQFRRKDETQLEIRGKWNVGDRITFIRGCLRLCNYTPHQLLEGVAPRAACLLAVRTVRDGTSSLELIWRADGEPESDVGNGLLRSPLNAIRTVSQTATKATSRDGRPPRLG